MKRLACVVLLAGCGYQMSVHAGPRTDLEGRVGVEFGMTMGMAVFAHETAQRTRALVASVEGTPYVTRREEICRSCPAARGASMTTSSELDGRAALRGMLEWVDEANTDVPRYVRAVGATRRLGVYAGADMDKDDKTLGLVGVTAGWSPWVWGYHGIHSEQWFALGVRLATELIPGETDGHRVVVRGLLQADIVYRERGH